MTSKRRRKTVRARPANPVNMMPVLMAFATALFIILANFFAVFYYVRLRREYGARAGAKRIFDLAAGWNAFVCSLSLGALCLLPFVLFHDKGAYAVYATLAPGVVACALLGKSIAITFLGVVVDRDRKMIFLPPSFASIRLRDYLMVLPAIRYMTRVDAVPFSGLKFLSREAGSRLYLHGDFISRKIQFSSKLKRDEALHAIAMASGINPRIMREID